MVTKAENAYSEALEKAVEARRALQKAFDAYLEAKGEADLCADDTTEEEQARVDQLHGVSWVKGDIVIRGERPTLGG
jgi:hypothetical protein